MMLGSLSFVHSHHLGMSLSTFTLEKSLFKWANCVVSYQVHFSILQASVSITCNLDRPHCGALLCTVTVDDVISDLVRFSVISSVAAKPTFISPSHPCFCCICILQPKFDWSMLHLLVIRVFVI